MGSCCRSPAGLAAVFEDEHEDDWFGFPANPTIRLNREIHEPHERSTKEPQARGMNLRAADATHLPLSLATARRTAFIPSFRVFGVSAGDSSEFRGASNCIVQDQATHFFLLNLSGVGVVSALCADGSCHRLDATRFGGSHREFAFRRIPALALCSIPAQEREKPLALLPHQHGSMRILSPKN